MNKITKLIITATMISTASFAAGSDQKGKEDLASAPASPAAAPVLQIQADHVITKMPPTFYGLMTEPEDHLQGFVFCESR